jgi:hypothetical protein
MNSKVMIKRSPVVLVWKFAVIETAGFLLYLGATMLGNAKYELYSQLFFSNLLSYQIARILFLSGAQFALTVYAFISWYYEYYDISPGSITYTHGVFLKKEKALHVDSSTMFTVSSNLMGKLFRYGSLRATTGASSLWLTYVSHPENLVKLIKRESDPHKDAFQKKPDVERLLTENEHDKLEFKSSLRFDYKTLQAGRDVEKAAMKTIAAFLNSKGGHLVLGVNDSLVTVGIENDYQTLQRKDVDGFENHFTQAFNSMIGPEFRNFIKLWFHKSNGHDLCVVQVLASPRPVYLKTDNTEQFYMRTGNISTALKLSEIESYSRSRWPRNVYED